MNLSHNWFALSDPVLPDHGTNHAHIVVLGDHPPPPSPINVIQETKLGYQSSTNKKVELQKYNKDAICHHQQWQQISQTFSDVPEVKLSQQHDPAQIPKTELQKLQQHLHEQKPSQKRKLYVIIDKFNQNVWCKNQLLKMLETPFLFEKSHSDHSKWMKTFMGAYLSQAFAQCWRWNARWCHLKQDATSGFKER